MVRPRLCSIPGCDNRHASRGYCTAHYERYKRHGDPLGGRTSRGEPMRHIYQHVLNHTGGECLPWPYHRDDDGYAKLRTKRAHRVVCELVNGPAPTPEHEAAHSCGNGHLGCVNPLHLEWKTHAANMVDRFIHGTTNRGERNGNAKLTESEVLAIRASAMKQKDLAEQYGVSKQLISSIKGGKCWKLLE